MDRHQLYGMTLGEFLNAYTGFVDNQQYEQRRAWERARFILSGLVKDPPSLPWDEAAESKPYSDEEIDEILSHHDDVMSRADKIVELTPDGPKDVSS